MRPADASKLHVVRCILGHICVLSKKFYYEILFHLLPYVTIRYHCYNCHMLPLLQLLFDFSCQSPCDLGPPVSRTYNAGCSPCNEWQGRIRRNQEEGKKEWIYCRLRFYHCIRPDLCPHSQNHRSVPSNLNIHPCFP